MCDRLHACPNDTPPSVASFRIRRSSLRSSVLKLFRLSPRELIRLCQISALLVLAEVSLCTWSLNKIQHAIHRRCMRAQTSRENRRAPQPITDFAWFVEIADCHGPFRPSCLRRSLVLAWLLSGRGIPTTLAIGVARSDDHVRAHAWLEEGPYSSPAGHEGYTPMLSPSSSDRADRIGHNR